MPTAEQMNRIERLMESGKPYLNTNLSLNQLAKQIDMAPRDLSVCYQSRFCHALLRFRRRISDTPCHGPSRSATRKQNHPGGDGQFRVQLEICVQCRIQAEDRDDSDTVSKQEHLTEVFWQNHRLNNYSALAEILVTMENLSLGCHFFAEQLPATSKSR